jgi:hypothetical protein
VEEAAPDSFDGVPLLNLQVLGSSFEKDREPDHPKYSLERLQAAISLLIPMSTESFEFAKAFDAANGRLFIGWKLTFGLY